MLIEYKKSFKKDLLKINDNNIFKKVDLVIEIVKQSNQLIKIPNFKKLKGFKEYYRIKISHYRICIKIKKVLLLC